MPTTTPRPRRRARHAARPARGGSHGAALKPAGRFVRFARAAAYATGRPWAFGIAFGVILAWAITGPLFHFSDTWQLAINTSTTIVTFLMVFLIQNSQNRDSEATQIKLDELIRAMRGAHLAVLDLEELSDQDLQRIRADYERLATEARLALRAGGSDTGSPDVGRSRS